MLTRAPGGLPPIVHTAERLLLCIEQAVRGFPRYHKYTLGAELRRQAMRVARLTHRAWRDSSRLDEYLHDLNWAVDELKLSLQLGRQIQAFTGFAQFEACAELAVQLGKQCGGWQRHRTSNGQNPGGSASRRARSDVLSTHAAPEARS